jgi:hypothetical protein
VFESRGRKLSPSEANREREARENERKQTKGLEHLASVTKLHAWLEERGHTEACANLYRCDPWKYEPILLDELYKLKSRGDVDTKELNELRGMIRAGSWMTYERRPDREAIQGLGIAKEREQSDWLWKIRNADPDTAKEHAENRDQILADLERIERELHVGKVGEPLEGTVSSIESLMAGAWHELKKSAAMHGIAWEDVKKHPSTKALFEEIEALRPVRDLAYFRRLYPKQVLA